MAKTAVEKSRYYRLRQRRKGLRPLTIWVPDLRIAAVRERLSAQCAILDNELVDPEIEALLDANLAEIEGWTV